MGRATFWLLSPTLNNKTISCTAVTSTDVSTRRVQYWLSNSVNNASNSHTVRSIVIDRSTAWQPSTVETIQERTGVGSGGYAGDLTPPTIYVVIYLFIDMYIPPPRKT